MPKTITAPIISAPEIIKLRAHIDEAISDPDYSVVVSYECRWDELTELQSINYEGGLHRGMHPVDSKTPLNFSAFKP